MAKKYVLEVYCAISGTCLNRVIIIAFYFKNTYFWIIDFDIFCLDGCESHITGVAAGTLGQYLKIQLLTYPDDYQRVVNWTATNYLLPETWPQISSQEESPQEAADISNELEAREKSFEEQEGNYYVDNSRARADDKDDGDKRQRVREDVEVKGAQDVLNAIAQQQVLADRNSAEDSKGAIVDVNDDDGGGDMYYEAEAWKYVIEKKLTQKVEHPVTAQKLQNTAESNSRNLYVASGRPPGSLSIEASYFVVFVVMILLLSVMYRLVRNRRVQISYRF